MVSFTLSQQSFDLLLYILNVILTFLDIPLNKDCISLRKIMKCAIRINVMKDGQTVYLKDYLKEHHIWKDLRFWGEHFYDEFYHKHKKYFPDSETIDLDFVCTLLCSFVLNMFEWNLSKESIEAFLKSTIFGSMFAPEESRELNVM